MNKEVIECNRVTAVEWPVETYTYSNILKRIGLHKVCFMATLDFLLTFPFYTILYYYVSADM